MIETLIFDFGDIFINLDKEASMREMQQLFPVFQLHPELDDANKKYEKGELSTKEFVSVYQEAFPSATENQLKNVWNAIIRDFPDYRMDFITSLQKSGKYHLILLSNTNALHIEKVQLTMGIEKYERFRACFDRFYLSHEIGYRKPDTSIFEFVLEQDQLKASRCLFVDDMPENVEAASQMGLHTWHLVPGKEDVIHLFDQGFPL